MSARTYTIGCPVTIEVDDDGTVRVTTYLGEAGEGVADYVDDLDPSTPGLQRQQAVDVVRIVTAIEAGTFTHTTSKGA